MRARNRYLSAGLAFVAAAMVACDDDPTRPDLTEDSRLIAIDAGTAHACALDADGAAYCWGANGSGRLGADAGSSASVPLRVRDVPAFVAISAGGAHTCALTAAGDAWCWGSNEYGQLGHDGGGDAERIDAGFAFGDIDAGQWHTCGTRLDDGRVFCWGENAHGQLGTGDLKSRDRPTAVESELRATDVAAGQTHSCAVSLLGAAYCWGDNERGQLGLGHTLDVLTPSQVGGPAVGMASVSAGFQLSCGLSAEGLALCWGSNHIGQAGAANGQIIGVPAIVDDEARYESIDAGVGEAACASSGGSTWCWGRVPGIEEPSPTPRRVARQLDLATVTLGDGFACGIDFEGGGWCWGAGLGGQLGNGEYDESSAPVEISTR